MVSVRDRYTSTGGGFSESKRAQDLGQLLGVNILPSQVVRLLFYKICLPSQFCLLSVPELLCFVCLSSFDQDTLQVIQGHTPFKQLVNRFENELVVAVGKGEPAAVMSEYGYKNVLSIDEYTSYFDAIDPLAPYKKWTTKPDVDQNSTSKEMAKRNIAVQTQRVKAAFMVSDSVDWSRDIQVLCDLLRTGGLPGRGTGKQPHLFFANDDLAYQATFPAERLGMGAFRIALEAIYNRIHPIPLAFTSYGKPNPFVYGNAETVLRNLMPSYLSNLDVENTTNSGIRYLKTLYMIGDNPKIDIRGAREAGDPWFSILTRTGVFKGKDNHSEFPADLVGICTFNKIQTSLYLSLLSLLVCMLG
ncbi:uncharacterized CDP-alcohol phosphatidyltransferase class-I family protein C22A12.08c-like isoform X4 [Syzygium oleosum]|uniref:uncharacterized CDP-alcohol phosphatidyltransferase class-I family protein C22A12.08c-like isoform X4 n=1 Tax=Syzygium oleosum TaxID=219896 RepID=UPI0024BAD78E|nr:uncharacterized CDP-alcohol phosphatidyltransferase class-I family protein C22A12.08c-like isoform X4 [Syzygium oleosum]